MIFFGYRNVPMRDVARITEMMRRGVLALNRAVELAGTPEAIMTNDVDDLKAIRTRLREWHGEGCLLLNNVLRLKGEFLMPEGEEYKAIYHTLSGTVVALAVYGAARVDGAIVEQYRVEWAEEAAAYFRMWFDMLTGER